MPPADGKWIGAYFLARLCRLRGSDALWQHPAMAVQTSAPSAGPQLFVAGPTRKLLVVADSSPECRVALHYAALRASHTGGRLTLLYVIEPGEFQHWRAVEERMREEARAEAERLLYDLATEANKAGGLLSEIVIREGKKKAEILAQISEDTAIRLLVLGAGTGREGPGPLVSSLTSDIVSVYPVPVTIVPGNMSIEGIDSIA